jgi:hypothetical protein
LSDSYEQFYQAIRRCWRFGQKKRVNCYIVTSSAEGAVVANVKRKEQDAIHMAKEMVANMHEINAKEIRGTVRNQVRYEPKVDSGEGWTMHLADAVEKVSEMPDNYFHYSGILSAIRLAVHLLRERARHGELPHPFRVLSAL